MDRNHIPSRLRRHPTDAGHDACIAIIDAGRYVHIDLHQPGADDSREIHLSSLSADRNRHRIRERVGTRKHLPGRDRWIRRTKSGAPKNDHLARAWRVSRW